MGGVRQQFSTAAEVRLARESIGFFQELGASFFQPVGYLFLATTEDGLADARGAGGAPARARGARGAGRRFACRRAAGRRRGRCRLLLGGRGRGPGGASPVSSCAGGALGVEVREGVDARELDRDVLVIAAGATSRGALAGASRAAALPSARRGRPGRRAYRTTCRWCSRRRPGSTSGAPATTLRLAMSEPTPRWTDREEVDEALVEDWRARVAHRYPAAAGAPVARAWAGLYDMTPGRAPDHRLGRRRRVRGVWVLRARVHAVACGREEPSPRSCSTASRRSTSARTIERFRRPSSRGDSS